MSIDEGSKRRVAAARKTDLGETHCDPVGPR